jgi:hypothetical protein
MAMDWLLRKSDSFKYFTFLRGVPLLDLVRPATSPEPLLLKDGLAGGSRLCVFSVWQDWFNCTTPADRDLGGLHSDGPILGRAGPMIDDDRPGLEALVLLVDFVCADLEDFLDLSSSPISILVSLINLILPPARGALLSCEEESSPSETDMRLLRGVLGLEGDRGGCGVSA